MAALFNSKRIAVVVVISGFSVFCEIVELSEIILTDTASPFSFMPSSGAYSAINAFTEDGVYFRKKAEEIVTLVHRTEAEMKNTDQSLVGDIYIGAGETDAVGNIVRVAYKLQKEFGGIHFHIISGDTADLTDRLDKGLFDFCLLLGEIDQSKYDYLSLPYTDTWGILMRKDSPLAEKEAIKAQDLWDKPLIFSRQVLNVPQFMRWFEKSASELNITATFNLAFNASIMAREHMGYVLTLDKLINTEGTNLCFRPLSPKQTVGMVLVWKKYQPQSKAAEKFIETLRNTLRH